MLRKKRSIHNNVRWVDAAASTLCNHILVNRTKCLIVLAGKRINRQLLKIDRNLLKDFGFLVIKTNSFGLGKTFNLLFSKSNDFFFKTFRGYTIIALSNTYKHKTINDINHLFNLPYRHLAPILVLSKNVLYTPQRLDDESLSFGTTQIRSTSLGFSSIFFLLFTIQKFIYLSLSFKPKFIFYSSVLVP